jgi:hypothetical protein
MTTPEVPQMPDPGPPPGKVKQTTTVETSVVQPNAFSRKVEDGGLLICVVMFGLWMLTAVLKNAGYIVGPCKNLSSGFPWEFLVSGAMLALPKIVGRATAGRVWEKLAGRGGAPEAP